MSLTGAGITLLVVFLSVTVFVICFFRLANKLIPFQGTVALFVAIVVSVIVAFYGTMRLFQSMEDMKMRGDF